MSVKRTAGIGFGILLPVVLLVGFLFRQDIYDWNRLRNYTPSQEIAKLAQDTTMLDSARRLFYVQHPLIADKQTFNGFCRENEHTIVLGCYIHTQGIYLLDVEDERLSGVEQVTAAHELLHAAYERLSGSERQRIDGLTQATYEASASERLKTTIELYRKRDPSVVPNELHSILATEIRTLPEELETYYKRYFSDRSKIVSFSEQYEQAFVERQNAIRAYDTELASLKTQIDTLEKALKTTSQELNQQRAEMNSLRSSGKTQVYNDQVPGYNQKVNKYNQDVKTLQGMIVRYNDIVQKRNDVAAEEAELVEAIDSRDVVPAEQ